MPLSDRYDVLALIDFLAAALDEQGWTHIDVFDCMRKREDGYGYGWRVWYADGRCVDSIIATWEQIEDGIVLGVAYEGETRRILQGVDPYWMDEQGSVHDSRRREPPSTLDRRLLKAGVWVSDAVMSEFRLKAVRSVALKELS